MDWEGQRLAERLMQLILFLGGLVSFAVGFVLKSYSAMMCGQAIAIALTVIITVPDWPFYNRHPRQWLDPSSVKPEAASTVHELVKARSDKKKGPAKAAGKAKK